MLLPFRYQVPERTQMEESHHRFKFLLFVFVECLWSKQAEMRSLKHSICYVVPFAMKDLKKKLWKRNRKFAGFESHVVVVFKLLHF